MREQRISEKIAKLAKEVGFNMELSEFYCENYKGLCEEHEEFLTVESLERGIYDCNNEFGEGERFSAPTQALLQKWLREIHDINVTIFICGANHHEYILHDKDRKYIKTVPNNITYENHKNNYEDTLEKGLLEALKLVKRPNMSQL